MTEMQKKKEKKNTPSCKNKKGADGRLGVDVRTQKLNNRGKKGKMNASFSRVHIILKTKYSKKKKKRKHKK